MAFKAARLMNPSDKKPDYIGLLKSFPFVTADEIPAYLAKVEDLDDTIDKLVENTTT